MGKFKKYLKRFGTDVAGYGLILLGLAFGWLPGPGGIPLILAGLGLLSVHNHWARRLLEYIQKNGVKLLDFLFPNKVWAKNLHDIFAVILIVIAVYLLFWQTSLIAASIAIALLAISIVDVLRNRNRLKKLKNKYFIL